MRSFALGTLTLLGGVCGVLLLTLPPLPAAADDSCVFGLLEMPFPGWEGQCVDKISFSSFTQKLFNFIVAFIVGIGLIAVVAGGYFYMTAGGNAAQVGTAKAIISSALLGIVLALTAYIVLNTVSPQFIENKEPILTL